MRSGETSISQNDNCVRWELDTQRPFEIVEPKAKSIPALPFLRKLGSLRKYEAVLAPQNIIFEDSILHSGIVLQRTALIRRYAAEKCHA